MNWRLHGQDLRRSRPLHEYGDPELPVVTTIDGNELRTVQGQDLEAEIPPWLDERAWVRVPAHAAHVLSESLLLRRNPLKGLLRFFNGATLIFPVALSLAIISTELRWNVVAVFTLNFLALVSLESVLNWVGEELVHRLWKSMGIVFSLLLPHILPLFVGVTSVILDEIRLAQSFIVGSILSNLLMGLGGSFVAGGIVRRENYFNITVAETEAGLLYVFVIPFAICKMLSITWTSPSIGPEKSILVVSRGSAIVLLLLFVIYGLFKYRTHGSLWEDEGGVEDDDADPSTGFFPRISLVAALISLVFVILPAITYCTRSLILSIDGLVESFRLTRTIIGLILLPVITNGPHYFKTYSIAFRDYMDVAVGLTLTASVSIALFVLPVLVITAWIISRPMSMEFTFLETIILGLGILVMSGLTRDGKSTFLEGAMALALYFIIVLTYIVYPDTAKGS